jgi:hypothetical protein
LLLLDAYAASLGLALGIIGFAWLVLPRSGRDARWLREGMICLVIVLNWLSRRLIMPFVTDVAQLVGAGPIIRSVWSGLLRGGPHGFKVTDKGAARGQTVIQWRLMTPFIALLAITVFGLCLPLFNDYSPAQKAGDGIVVILFWTLYNVVVLGLTILVCIEPPRPPHTMRRGVEASTLRTQRRALACWVAAPISRFAQFADDLAQGRTGPPPENHSYREAEQLSAALARLQCQMGTSDAQPQDHLEIPALSSVRSDRSLPQHEALS